MPSRRDVLKAAFLPLAAQDNRTIVVDPKPQFRLSPLMYMQFMEPLGVTDSSVEAAWDYDADDWRKDFIEVVKGLSPNVMRWGGLYSRYYKWREGAGPANKRPPMRNYAWGGMETNRVGTREFVDFCRRVNAEPLMCVNFQSDGFQQYLRAGRSGDAQEAADWVSYANAPEKGEALKIRLWQLGNETSYGKGGFTRDESIAKTIEFATAMKARDRSIQLIGWGDRAGKGTPLWAGELLKRAGEHLDFVAIHMMGMSPQRPDTVLKGNLYQKDPQRAWQELLELTSLVEKRVEEIVQVVDDSGSNRSVAITEGHLSLSPHNANPILTEWLSAAYHARTMNIYERYGRRIGIMTGADFEGSRWTVNAVLLQVPRGVSYLTPIGSIMKLFGTHRGEESVRVTAAPGGLDISASRTGNRVFLHVLNMEYDRAVEARFSLPGKRVLEIAPQDARTAVGPDNPNVFEAQEHPLGDNWRFPARSVSVVELEMR